MIKVSTKTGDKGTTSLLQGVRVSKADEVIEIIGTSDELNSWLGLIVADFGELFADHKEYLLEIQDTIFYVGAELAGSKKTVLKQNAVDKVERESNKLQAAMADDWHAKFLLPGGTRLGAHLDITRTVCRRLERIVAKYAEDHKISPIILKYFNRLSDYLYILRCFVNHKLEYHEREFVKK